MTLQVLESVSGLWGMADEQDRRTIGRALVQAAEQTTHYIAGNRAVAHRRGKDGGLRICSCSTVAWSPRVKSASSGNE